MSTLLLRLAAPMQSWGIDAKFDRRGTQRHPTKSGVIGLVAAAMGRRRNESLEDLYALRFGVRVDRQGTLLRDYHTAKSKRSAYVTHRYYLSDAVFLVGLEGDEGFLMQIHDALHRPAFPLFLGRRSCPPEGRISLGIRSGQDLLKALQGEPRLIAHRFRGREAEDARLPITMDAQPQDTRGYFQRDVPLSFDQTHRQYGFRRVIEPELWPFIQESMQHVAPERATEHDPMSELGEV